MFHLKSGLRFKDGDSALLVDEDPVQVQRLAYPGLDVLDLVAELRHVGEGQAVHGIPV